MEILFLQQTFYRPKNHFHYWSIVNQKKNLQQTHQKKTKFYAERNNFRSQFVDFELAETFFHSPDFQSALEDMKLSHAHSLNPNFRLYKYECGQLFGPHYDEEAKVDKLTGKFTILIYLSGLNVIPNLDHGTKEVLIGGETVFYLKGDTIKVRPETGLLLFHAQGRDCLLHAGELVTNGVKWVLRSDLMFDSSRIQ
jgi:hypothetical protein